MARTSLTLSLILIVLTAGCSGLFGGAEDRQTDTPDTTIHAETSTTVQPIRHNETTLREVVLSQSELSVGYRSKGQMVLSQEEASGEDATQFDQRGLELVVERTFTYSGQNDTQPEIIFSSAMLYRSKIAATDDLDRIISEFRSSDKRVSESLVTGSETAIVVRFENDQGYQNTIYYGRVSDVVFYVVISDDKQYYEEYTEELFTQMLIDYKNQI